MQKQLVGLSANKANEIRSKTLYQNADLLRNFEVQAVKARSATAQFTEQLVKQDVTMRGALKSRQIFNATLKEQYALQKMMAVQWSRSATTGTIVADTIVPRGTTSQVDALSKSFKANYQALRTATKGTQEHALASELMRMRMGMLSQVINSGAENMIKWGKNTQWAGRQLMVGFTVPFAAFAAVTGKMFYDLDKQLTDIAKVYDTYATTAIGREQELAGVRKASYAVAMEAARMYGSSVKDTLDVEQQLAATGQRGSELLHNTAQVQKAATVGQMDYNKATEAAITLNTVFGQTSQQVGDSFAYMSAIANATSLTMEDFSSALPRVAGTVHALGGSLQDVGLLLTAMKAQGINAGEGANAIRSGAASMIKPTKQAKQILDGFGISIENINKATGGNVIKNFELLSAEMAKAGLSASDQQKALTALFGKYQLNRVNAIVNGLKDVTDQTTQMGRAFKLSEGTADEWQAIYTGAFQTVQDSASNKFKRALETFKGSMAQVGSEFLPVAGKVLEFLAAIAHAFTSMPGPIKAVAKYIMAAFAIAGPLIMITGLFSNMFGQIFKVVNGLASLKLRFKAMTPEQRVQAMLAEQSSTAWEDQAMAARALSTQLGQLVGQLNAVTGAQKGAAAAASKTASSAYITARTDKNGRSYYTNAQGRRVSRADYDKQQNANVISQKTNKNGGTYYQTGAGKFASKAAYDAQQMALATNTTARNWGLIGARMQQGALAAGTIGLVFGGSGKWVTNISQMLLMIGLFGPQLAGVFKAVAKSKAMTSIGTALTANLAGGKIMGSVGKLGGAIAKLGPIAFGPWGIAAAAAIGTALYAFKKIHADQKKAREEQDQIANSAQDWAKILGFSVVEMGQVKTAGGEIRDGADAVAKKFREANKPIAEMVRHLKDAGDEQGVINAAIAEGLKVRAAGGGVSQANAAAATTLKVAGYTTDQTKELMVKVKAQVDFGDAASTINGQMAEYGAEAAKVFGNHFSDGGKWETMGRFLSGHDEYLNSAAKEGGKNIGKSFMESFTQMTMADRRNFADRFAREISGDADQVLAGLSAKAQGALKNAGISSAQDLAKQVFANGGLDKGLNKLFANGAVSASDLTAMRNLLQGQEQIARGIAKANGATDDQIKKIHTLADVMKTLDMAQMTVADAQSNYDQDVIETSRALGGLTEAQKLAILNQYRHKAGLDDATSSADGFNVVLRDSNKILDENGQVASDAAMSAEELAGAWSDATKSAMSNSQDFAISTADHFKQLFDQSEVDAIQKRGDQAAKALENAADAQDKVFENRGRALDKKWSGIDDAFTAKWEKRIDTEKKAYDARINNIKKGMDAEALAEEQRQKMFEAEKTRLERLANLANMNIDLNVQLSQGNMDEAAKTFNDIQATQTGYDLTDADAAAAASAEAKKKQREDEITKIENARDARIESLKKVEDAEKKALEDKKQREKDALDAEKERYHKSIDAQKAAIAEQTANDVKAKQADQWRRQQALDLEIATIRASTPRNVAEYNAQIAQIEAAYKKYGIDLKAQGDDWSKTIGNGLQANIATAAAAMRDQIKWKTIAADIVNQFTGVFGLSADEFKAWITTGKFPDHPKGPQSSGVPSSYSAHDVIKHDGGLIGGSRNSRRGYSRGAGKMPSEVSMLARKGEYVVNHKAVNKIGTDNLDAINQGQMPAIGGPDLGMATMFAGTLGGMMKAAMLMSIMQAGENQMNMTGSTISGAPGKYANVNLGADQLGNAAKIIAVGRQMGASNRDIQIALMTAMQESTLRNLSYGDRDSLGLFQQRPSQGWGTPGEIMVPEYAAKQFFTHLFGVKDRGSMSLAQAAQAVQRSAYPDAYAKWEQMAASILGTSASTGASVTSAMTGFMRPIAGGRISSRFGMRKNPITGEMKLHNGTDIAAPIGTPIYASNSGEVIWAGSRSGYGNFTVIKHANGMVTGYAHQSKINVKQGQNVARGQIIGAVGSTGNSTGPHLHFMTGRGNTINSQWENPGFTVPGLKVGGQIKYDNTLANLHKKETVLTAPLSAKLERGIDRIDQGTANQYTVAIDLRGAYIKDDVDIESAVNAALDKRESRLGRKRKI